MPEYGRTLRFEDFGFAADKSLVTGSWNRVGTQFTVPAGTKYAIGRRFDGYVAVDLKDTSDVSFHGKVRVVASDPQEFTKVVVCEFNTRTIGSLTDKRQKKLLPLTMPWVKQDSKLILEIDPEANNTLDYGNTLSAIDTTVKVS